MTDKLVLVEWIDSRCRTGWQNVEDAVRDASEPLSCETVGWLIVDNDEYVLVAPNRNVDRKPGNTEVCDLMQIPRVAVTGIRPLAVGRRTRT